MAGKRSRGEGSITYDARRKRYRARVTVGWELNEETGRSKQIVKTLGSNYKTKGEATRALSEYLNRPYNIDNKDITFSNLYEVWFNEYFGGEEHKSMEYRVRAAYKYCSKIYNKKIREVTILDMKDCIYKGTAICIRGKYKGELRPASPQTKESIKYLFNHIFAYATEARLVERNYAKDFSLDKKVEQEKNKNHKDKIPLSEEEINKLWKSIEFVPFSDMIIYACYSGWRPTELIKLKIEDVNLDEWYIKGGIKTKAGKNRIVPIHPLVKDIVVKYYNDAKKIGSEYLFNDINHKCGKGLSYDQYTTRFSKVITQLHLRPELSPHYTRHTFITKAKSRDVNMNEYILKLIVGHDIGDITEHIYTHREIEDLKLEMNKIKS